MSVKAVASAANDMHLAGAEVTQQQEAVLHPSTAVPDLWHACQISVSESFPPDVRCQQPYLLEAVGASI